MIGRTISHYRIVEKLGEGGMGVVYKAEDTRLHRIVALKFLPPELTRDAAAKERFIQEAQAASALEHPNICNVHEIDETTDGQTFIAMACYEGESLKAKIERGPLGIEEALDVASQVAQGLAKAHNRGIVHRDIKPANILITEDGLVKVVDFGLAKLAGAKLTKTGSTLGTAQYMSPEQARGEAVDARSDIFSLGAVLYEMVTGKHAFPGEYEQATIYAIMNEEPPPVTSLRSGIPMELERIITKALAKKPSERYQHADDLIVDLKSVARESVSAVARGFARPRERGPESSPGRRPSVGPKVHPALRLVPPIALLAVAVIAIAAYFISSSKREERTRATPPTVSPFAAPAWRDSIAVLPFKDFSAAKDQEYFCDGMTEDIITKLSKIHDLKVISRTSAMRFKSTEKSIREIARELGVGTILEGSVQKQKDEIRVNVQLIRAADDAHLWAEKYDRKLESVFQVQDEISMAIAEALKLKLTSREKEGMTRLPIDNVAAYECYLRAVQEIRRFDERGIDRAVENLQKGLSIIGDNALLYAGMAYAYYMYVNIGVRQEEDIERAEAHAKEALALDPDCAQAHVVLGDIHSAFRGNQQEAVRQYKRALSINPNDPIALRSLAGQYLWAGRGSLAPSLLERAKQIDPLNAMKSGVQIDLLMSQGRYQEALRYCKQQYEADPESPMAQAAFALTLTYNGRFAEALPIIDRLAESSPNNVTTKFMLLLKYGMQKDREKAFAMLTPDFQKTCRRDFQWSYNVAGDLSLLGAKEEALDWLENAINRGFLDYGSTEHDFLLDNIRGEERFKKLMERAKYESDHFEI
jgi:serine/threonine protein kinase/tetratricopeptide (TPR) repeat protein